MVDVPEFLRSHQLIHTKMKREITFMSQGLKADGSSWHMLVFACTMVDDTLYSEVRQFVPKTVYDALHVGQTIVVK
jgi:hypothetical protein